MRSRRPVAGCGLVGPWGNLESSSAEHPLGPCRIWKRIIIIVIVIVIIIIIIRHMPRELGVKFIGSCPEVRFKVRVRVWATGDSQNQIGVTFQRFVWSSQREEKGQVQREGG